jgi:hypothetical protein
MFLKKLVDILDVIATINGGTWIQKAGQGGLEREGKNEEEGTAN